MMKSKWFLFIQLWIIAAVLKAQHYSFESGIISPFQVLDAATSHLQSVDVPYKDGNASLSWTWTAPSVIRIDQPVKLKNFRDGVIFWVYNETPLASPLLCEFRDASDKVRYYFYFGLNFKGWRICRIGSRYMLGDKSVGSNLKMYFKTPSGVNQGRLFIDRFAFVADVSHQNAPDAQQPNNTEPDYINHWNSLWKWESGLTYDLPLLDNLNAAQLASLETIARKIAQRLLQTANAATVNKAKTLFNKANIRKQNGCWIGAPLVLKPDATHSDIDLAQLGTMMYGMAMDAAFNNNSVSLQHYLDLWDYAHDQGFAYGSAMGNNHHYGYETKLIFQAAYLMKKPLESAGKIEEVTATLSFWSGLAETRKAFDNTREGVVDCWNTLLFPRLISAMLIQDMPRKYQAVKSLVRWVNTSLAFTPGNMGGLKPDGTIFHHAGHYPAYGIGGFSGLGNFIATLPETEFNLDLPARHNLAEALFAMSRYTHTTDWSIGMSGRHPHQGNMTNAVIETFGLLALMGGVYDANEAVDARLAGEYLRLETQNTPLKQQLAAFTPNALPSGFFVFNHAAAGVLRIDNSMVSVKGYNSDVWGSEIYTKDNRYGRYQSYGAVEIFNEGNPVSRRNSRFNEAGWDWNRLPGTTTIHLPPNLLESPVTTTLMARSKEDFAGASSLMGRFGLFGMKLREENLINNTNYTPDFKARKSVFAFGKRLVCLGSGISNSNQLYPTETTLFQQTINASTDKTEVNGVFYPAMGYAFDSQQLITPVMLSDLSGNYYRISPLNRVIIEGKEQQSKHNKTKADTKGNFLVAYIDHGKNPVDAAYEYMIMLKPTLSEQEQWSNAPGYRVLQADNQAHVVYDSVSAVTAFVCYETSHFDVGLIGKVDAETLLMFKYRNEHHVVMSVCDPSLHLPEKTNNSNNTSLEGVETTKEIRLHGLWQLKQPFPQIKVSYQGNLTEISVSCRLGIPVEFEMEKLETALENLPESKLNIVTRGNSIEIRGATKFISVYDATGRQLASKNYPSEKTVFWLNPGQLYFLLAYLPDDKVLPHKFYL